MDTLMSYLRQFAVLSNDECHLIGRHVRQVFVPCGNFLLEIGEVPSELPFVNKGVLRIGTYERNDIDITKRFVVDSHFLFDVFTVGKRAPSRDFVQAVLDSELLILTRDSVQYLSTAIPVWNTIMAHVTGNVLREGAIRPGVPPGVDATSRYVSFENDYPGLCDRIGLTSVASYLGISTSTLSRIRRNRARLALR